MDHFSKIGGIKLEMDIPVATMGNGKSIRLVFKNENEKEEVITNLDWISLYY
ncbi:hypothetical protein [Arenibacter amylolyticus]|uniref:hypothetical protein n=1 Tax=Arenibacter amylolyticus TaxID=1406873 RepID=UPI001592B978|nr:hypothetical protein [Arenibacter amylolyticus]